MGACSSSPSQRPPDVHYQPTPMAVVRAMLELAVVGPSDVVYDLGCGDGRIVIEAVRSFGARGVCIDSDGLRVRAARQNARLAGVEERIEFAVDDIFTRSIADATVVALFLNADTLLRLRPKLQKELKPNARIVSHMYRIGDWEPARSEMAPGPLKDHPIFLWML